MSTKTISPGSYRYNVDGSSWVSSSMNVGVTGGGVVYRAYMTMSLSSIDSTKIISANASLTLKREDNYGYAHWAVGLRDSAPSKFFTASDMDDVIADDFQTTSYEQKTITIDKSVLSKYRGKTVYVCVCGNSSYSYSYGEIDTSSNPPSLGVTYTEAISTMTITGDTIGEPMTFSIQRNSDSFTHTLQYTTNGGSSYTTIATKTSLTAVPWTPPMTLCELNTSGTTVTVGFRLITYSGSSNLGNVTDSMSLIIPDFVVPTIDSDAITLSPSSDNATVDGWGVYLQNYARVHGVWNLSKVHGAYGSTIAADNCRFIINGTGYSGADRRSGVLTTFGEQTVTVRVTDSRSRTASITKTITVQKYTKPYVNPYKCYRSNSSGVAQDGGTYIAVAARVRITSVGTNTGTVSLKYKKRGTSTWTTESITPGDGSTVTVIAASLDPSSTYDAVLSPGDTLNTTGTEIQLALPAMSADIIAKRDSDGFRIGFGMIPPGSGFRGAAALGAITAHDSNGYKRINIDGDTGNITMRDSSDNVKVQIRSDGNESSAPVPVKSGGTGMTSNYVEISTAPTDKNKSFDFTVTANMTVGSVTVPRYSKGRFIGVGNDAILIAVTSGSNPSLYIGYRNDTTWAGKQLT